MKSACEVNLHDAVTVSQHAWGKVWLAFARICRNSSYNWAKE
jgi:hypothetical protein